MGRRSVSEILSRTGAENDQGSDAKNGGRKIDCVNLPVVAFLRDVRCGHTLWIIENFGFFNIGDTDERREQVAAENLQFSGLNSGQITATGRDSGAIWVGWSTDFGKNGGQSNRQ